MQLTVALQIVLARERLDAARLVAFERAFAFVGADVAVEVVFSSEALQTAVISTEN